IIAGVVILFLGKTSSSITNSSSGLSTSDFFSISGNDSFFISERSRTFFFTNFLIFLSFLLFFIFFLYFVLVILFYFFYFFFFLSFSVYLIIFSLFLNYCLI